MSKSSRNTVTGDGITAQGIAEWTTDTWRSIGGVLPPDPTPIADALRALCGPLMTIDDCAALGNLVGVRTLGDLRTVLERGEIAGELGEKLREMLG